MDYASAFPQTLIHTLGTLPRPSYWRLSNNLSLFRYVLVLVSFYFHSIGFDFQTAQLSPTPLTIWVTGRAAGTRSIRFVTHVCGGASIQNQGCGWRYKTQPESESPFFQNQRSTSHTHRTPLLSQRNMCRLAHSYDHYVQCDHLYLTNRSKVRP